MSDKVKLSDDDILGIALEESSYGAGYVPSAEYLSETVNMFKCNQDNIHQFGEIMGEQLYEIEESTMDAFLASLKISYNNNRNQYLEEEDELEDIANQLFEDN